MTGAKRRELAGRFRVIAGGEGTVRLEREDPEQQAREAEPFAHARAEIFIRGAEPPLHGVELPPADVAGVVLRDPVIEWRGAGATLQAQAERPIELSARSIIVHEPLTDLYDDLPLTRGGDRASAVLWSRVFRLARWPGGRFLISALARRARKGK